MFSNYAEAFTHHMVLYFEKCFITKHESSNKISKVQVFEVLKHECIQQRKI